MSVHNPITPKQRKRVKRFIDELREQSETAEDKIPKGKVADLLKALQRAFQNGLLILEVKDGKNTITNL